MPPVTPACGWRRSARFGVRQFVDRCALFVDPRPLQENECCMKATGAPQSLRVRAGRLSRGLGSLDLIDCNEGSVVMLRRTAPHYLLTSSAAAIAMVISAPAAAAAAAQGQPAPVTPQLNSQVEPTPTPTDETQQPSSTNLSSENALKPANEAIVITGSRIRRPDFNTPNPMVSIGADQVERSGTTNLTQFLTGFPALQGSSGSDLNSGNNAAIGYTGLNLLNLRNLGIERTLVLIDGRRQVASVPGTQAVDINTIPTDLVERIDIQTGGASAVYGADGVSGVVNFVMKHDFDGIRVRGQNGISGEGDAGQRLIAV